ncbi:hypothetical protein Tco_0735308 [Tanacetum coccineum]
MIDVINHENSVSPLPVSEKTRKKKSQTVTKPNPKSQGHEASGAPSQKGKKSKTKKTSLLVSLGQTTNPQDTKGNKQPAVKGLPSTADEDISKSSHLSKAKPTNPQNTEGNIQTTIKGFPATTLMKGSAFNLGKTSSKVELDTEPVLLTTFGDFQAFLDSEDELKDESDEEMFEAGKEMDKEFLQSANEETQPPHSTETPTEEPIST